MKLIVLLLAMGMGISAGAQSSGAGDAAPQGRSAVAGTASDSKPAPLKCGKWEHVEEICHSPAVTCLASSTTQSVFGGCGCAEPTEKVCKPDLHTITEREWQELMARLRDLERASANPSACKKEKGCITFHMESIDPQPHPAIVTLYGTD